MRCEDVQSELNRGAIDSAPREAMDSHLATCAPCRMLVRIDAEIDRTLKTGAYWKPPSGFAQRVVIKANAGVWEQPPKGLSWTECVNAILVGGLCAAGSMLAARMLFQLTSSTNIDAAIESFFAIMLANASLLAWTSCAISLFISVWLTRHALQ